MSIFNIKTNFFRNIAKWWEGFVAIKAVFWMITVLVTVSFCSLLCVLEVNILFMLLSFFLLYYVKDLRKHKEPTYYHFCLIFLMTVGALVSPYASSFASLINVGPEFNIYMQPTIALIVLINVLFNNVEFSVIYLFFSVILMTLLNRANLDLSLLYLISGFVAIIFTSNVRRRVDMIRAGIIIGLIHGLGIVALLFYRGVNIDFFHAMLSGLSTGFIAVGVVMATWQIFEFVFGQITNISLLEMSDFNHPLLRRMVLEAPGSYQHSLVVANLSEAAAEAIGANSLLTRVGAYYHDIGKLSKAEYFSENQMLATYRDKHKKLSPSMSTLIIMNHVKEGLELAKKYRLKRKIRDFIEQHHGTTLVYYFYAKAQQQQSQQKVDDQPKEEVFRYPGPKPQSKEVAIVHLADTIEARSRTLEEPTPARIKEMVRESITKKFLDGQLDQTELTLRDIEIISEVFIRLINSMFHTRVDYPKDKEKANDSNGSTDKQYTKNQTNK